VFLNWIKSVLFRIHRESVSFGLERKECLSGSPKLAERIANMSVGRERLATIGWLILAFGVAGAWPALGQSRKGEQIPEAPGSEDVALFDQYIRNRSLIEKYLERKNPGSGKVLPDREYFQTSGNPAVDRMVEMDLLFLEGRFRVSPNHVYYQEPKGRNAYWTPKTIGPVSPLGRVVSNSFGTMSLGRNLINHELGLTPKDAARNFTVAAIMAHELGHMAQFVRKSQLSPPQKELQADFLAGWSIRCAKRSTNPELHEGDIFKTVYDLGDELHYTTEHHGTSDERLQAFRKGFQVVSDDIDVAYAKGKDYVLQAKPETRPPLSIDFQPFAWPDENGRPVEPTKLMRTEYYSRKLGIHFQLSPASDGSFGLALTRFPIEGSPASRCGLEWMDEIVELDAKPLRSLTAVESLRGKVQIKVIDIRTEETRESEIEFR
jgi:hypothetical protein